MKKAEILWLSIFLFSAIYLNSFVFAAEPKIDLKNFPAGDYNLIIGNNSVNVKFYEDGKWETDSYIWGHWVYYEDAKFIMAIYNWKDKNFDANSAKIITFGKAKIEPNKIIVESKEGKTTVFEKVLNQKLSQNDLISKLKNIGFKEHPVNKAMNKINNDAWVYALDNENPFDKSIYFFNKYDSGQIASVEISFNLQKESFNEKEEKVLYSVACKVLSEVYNISISNKLLDKTLLKEIPFNKFLGYKFRYNDKEFYCAIGTKMIIINEKNDFMKTLNLTFATL